MKAKIFYFIVYCRRLFLLKNQEHKDVNINLLFVLSDFVLYFYYKRLYKIYILKFYQKIIIFSKQKKIKYVNLIEKIY